MFREILHCDLNNFFASVECMLDPSLDGKYVAVCGNTEERHGIVLAKNTAAKAFGVATGEAIWQAKAKCPELVTVSPHYSQYVTYSRIVRRIYSNYTDLVEPFGIDECWLDVTGSTRLFGSSEKIADAIRQEVKAETGLTVSVGVSFNKAFAKLGSDIKKPDAVTVISLENFKEKVWPLPVFCLLGVGRKTGERMKELGIFTIGQLALSNPKVISSNFGKCGTQLYLWANGMDNSSVRRIGDDPIPQSVGHGVTMASDISEAEEARGIFLYLTQEIGHKLIKQNLIAKGVRIGVKDSSLKVHQFQSALKHPCREPMKLTCEAMKLLVSNYDWEKDVRALTVTAYDLQRETGEEQTDMFYDLWREEKHGELHKTVDCLRARYGNSCVVPATLLGDMPVSIRDEESYTPFCRHTSA